MTGFQKDVLEIMLKSQLAIERARLKAIVENNMANNLNCEYNICSAVVDEIERQLSVLKEKKADYFIPIVANPASN
jgi:hypothetical protein